MPLLVDFYEIVCFIRVFCSTIQIRFSKTLAHMTSMPILAEKSREKLEMWRWIENSVEIMRGRVNFRWNNIISNNFSTFLECFDSRDLWLAIKISRKIEHRTSACRQFNRNRIYFFSINIKTEIIGSLRTEA